MKFDVLFVDMTCPRPYDFQSLKTEALGGTEATVIRVAQGLGDLGYKIGIIQHNLEQPTFYGNTFYLPLHYIDKVDTSVFVMLRGVAFHDRFPKSLKISWHHDLPNEKLLKMRDVFIKHDITVMAVSSWHKTAIQELICDPNKTINPSVTYVYPPIDPEHVTSSATTPKYNKNKLMWLASPHKGLKEAVIAFQRLVEISGNKKFELHVTNPGYLANEYHNAPGIIMHGALPGSMMGKLMQDSLCLFYPSKFQETFGLIGAEANARGVPVAAYSHAGLNESVADRAQLVALGDEKSLVNRVIEWYSGYRPNVIAQLRFTLPEVLNQWLSLIKQKNTKTK